jgi:hypothetical protein
MRALPAHGRRGRLSTDGCAVSVRQDRRAETPSARGERRINGYVLQLLWLPGTSN